MLETFAQFFQAGTWVKTPANPREPAKFDVQNLPYTVIAGGTVNACRRFYSSPEQQKRI